jgi:hypothetical protein
MATTTDVTPNSYFVSSPNSPVIETRYDVYDSIDATNDGEWIDIAGAIALVIENVESSFVGTLKLGGSEASSAPANTADGIDLNADIADGFTEYSIYNGDVLPRFIKLHVHAYTSGTSVVKIKVVKRFGDTP